MRYDSALRKATLTPVVLFAMLVTGCSEAPVSGIEAESVRYVKLGGEDLFNGLLFGRGAAAAALPEVWENPHVRRARSNGSVELEEKQTEMFDYIQTSIKAADPTFFGRFGTAVTSGDHIAVRAAIMEAGRLTESALMSHPDPDVRAAAAGAQRDVVPGTEPSVVVVAVVYAAVYLWDWYWGPDLPSVKPNPSSFTDAPALRQDELIHLVTVRLKS